MVESVPAIRAEDEEKKGMHRTECSGCIQYLNVCLKYAEFTGSVFMQIQVIIHIGHTKIYSLLN
jgi:hypothetical protein